MRTERITSAQHPLYAQAMEVYRNSFPSHEQREAASQERILHDSTYHFTGMCSSGWCCTGKPKRICILSMPRWQFDICATSRIELRRDGKTYCSSNDLTAALTVGENETSAGGPPADPAAGVRHTRPLPPPVQPGRRLPVRGADPARRASIHCYSENWR